MNAPSKPRPFPHNAKKPCPICGKKHIKRTPAVKIRDIRPASLQNDEWRWVHVPCLYLAPFLVEDFKDGMEKVKQAREKAGDAMQKLIGDKVKELIGEKKLGPIDDGKVN